MERRSTIPEDTWKQSVLRDVERVQQIPEQFFQRGPVVKIIDAKGRPIQCESFLLDLHAAAEAGIEDLIDDPTSGDERAFLIARDASGNILGTRITKLYVSTSRILAYSEIKVVEKGKGYAAPIEEGFQQQLQRIANTKHVPVAWKITNENLAVLEHYKQSFQPDPRILKQMELEQQRWLALYGPSGKLGITNNEKVFTPKAVV